MRRIVPRFAAERDEQARIWPAMEIPMLNQLLQANCRRSFVEAQNSPYLARAKKLLLVMLGLWMTYFLLVNWFVHSLNKIAVPVLDIPLGTYLAVQGAAIVFAVALFRFARTRVTMHTAAGLRRHRPDHTLSNAPRLRRGRDAASGSDHGRYRATAFYLTVWYAFLATLGAVLLIALNDVEPATAFLIAANLALLFALALMARRRPPDQRASRAGQFWRTCRRSSARLAMRACAWHARAGRDLAALRQGRRDGRDRSLRPRLCEQRRQREPRGPKPSARRAAQMQRAADTLDELPVRALAADELKQHLAPVRPRAVLGQIDALPGAERELSAASPARAATSPLSIAFTCAGMSSGPSVSCTHPAFAGARRRAR